MNKKNRFLIYILSAALAVTMLSAISCSKTAVDNSNSVSTTSIQTIAAETTTTTEVTTAETTTSPKTSAASETTAATETTVAAETTSASDTTKVEKKELILASTTSTDDSGLFDVLLPDFEKATGYKVKLISVGSGEAMKLGERGEADVLLVHSRKAEDKFMADGFGSVRKDVMHNDFVVVGPAEDRANIKGKNVVDAFKAISDSGVFVSRADNSGTNTKELGIWQKAGVSSFGEWYIQTGQGMGETLTITNEKLAYTLTDRATWLAMKKNFSLEILVEGDALLLNPYGVIAVNPSKYPNINNKGAMAFIDYITGERGQALIKDFGVKQYGQPLFYPDVIK
jgi:tungstate transport system substrate-binding protein